jgi:Xaa-Pro dipeptidase
VEAVSALLTPQRLGEIQSLLRDANVDGWLLYDFRGLNPIALGLLGHAKGGTRRIAAWIPASGAPAALSHAIEQAVWSEWPTAWPRTVYASWRDLEAFIATHVAGRRVAMEYSAHSAVPTLDRVPAGVIDLVRAAGGTVVSSAPLVTRLYAVWTASETAAHVRSAEQIAAIAHDAARHAGRQATTGAPLTEHELVEWIAARFAAAGLVTASLPHVAVGVNAADPHYTPSVSASARIEGNQLLLIDLWAREPGGIYADQTWMASLGAPSTRGIEVWTAVRDARNAAAQLLRERISRGEAVRGADADDAARALLRDRGFAKWFTHRTGHSIDARELHGAGPNLDNLETRDDRPLVPGVGFSIEPGVYIPGEIGVRSEVNAYVSDEGLVVTPSAPQQELWVV